MAEWLGTALQKLLQRFESASDLTKTALGNTLTLFLFLFVRYLYGKPRFDYRSIRNSSIKNILYKPFLFKKIYDTVFGERRIVQSYGIICIIWPYMKYIDEDYYNHL